MPSPPRLSRTPGRTPSNRWRWATLKIRASYHPHGDWQLRVLVGKKNKQVLADQIVSSKTVDSEWLELTVDLTRFAGQTIDLTVENRGNNWMNEFGYWGRITVVSE